MMSQNITIQRKISIENFLYTLFKSGQTSFNQAVSLHRESVNRTFIVRTMTDSHSDDLWQTN